MKRFKLIVLALLVISLTAAALLTSCGKKNTGDDSPKTVTVKVIGKDKSEKVFTITTTGKTLADALDQEKLVECTDGMIITVDGVRADYSLDHAYWAITKSGVMLMTGAADEYISDGGTYELTYTEA